MKGSVFNILADIIMDRDVLDIFAGTGSLGIEALSRGARSAVFMDKSPESCAIIKDNLAHTKLIDLADVYCVDYVNGIERLNRDERKFDLILMDIILLMHGEIYSTKKILWKTTGRCYVNYYQITKDIRI